MIYDYVIVGGGISGLNTGVELLKKNPNLKVLIVEKNPSRTGGRVFTDKFKVGKTEYALDAGAGRFSDTHKRVLSLISRYSLDSKVLKLAKGSNFVKTRKYSKNVKFTDSNSIIHELIRRVELMTREEKELIKEITFKELAAKLFNRETANFLENGYPYYSEISIINAFSAVRAFKKDLNSRKNFYILLGGLSQITDNLTQEYLKLGGRLVYGYTVSNVVRNKADLFTLFPRNTDSIKKRCRNIVFTMPKNVLEKISILDSLKSQLESLQCKPLYRIYAIYPKDKATGKVWWHDIPRTITDSVIKYIIPINPNDGSIMISYTDGPNAQYWHSVPDNKLVSLLHKEVKRCYPDIGEIPQPQVIKKYYWSIGACYYRKKTNPTKLQKEMINPLNGVYICGDSFSSHQAWMEGALETSENVIKSIFS